LRKLPVDFPNLKVITLEQNYRSTSAILRAANNVIGPNPKLFPKNLWSDLGEGEPVRVVDADTEEHEAERAVARIQSLRSGMEVVATSTAGAAPQTQYKELKDFAILYRANHQAKTFERPYAKRTFRTKSQAGKAFLTERKSKTYVLGFGYG
jgi:ATP-dependent DNA helicase Rep